MVLLADFDRGRKDGFCFDLSYKQQNKVFSVYCTVQFLFFYY